MNGFPDSRSIWHPGAAPVAVVMISLNEGHNIESVLENLKGWAQEVFLVDSYSKDNTVSIALHHGVHVVQRRFQGFGDQWNFALNQLPITAPWTMKMDPDERLSPTLKDNIVNVIRSNSCNGIEFDRRWWLMGSQLPIRDKVLRVWRTGCCVFSDVAVNEHPIVEGHVRFVIGDMEHMDSPDLDHWIEKQNRYSSAEAVTLYKGQNLAAKPELFGSALQRRMWLKWHFYRVPGRHIILFLYFWIYRGLWRSGKVGYYSARLWTDVFRWKELKMLEMKITGRILGQKVYGPGQPDPRVEQY